MKRLLRGKTERLRSDGRNGGALNPAELTAHLHNEFSAPEEDTVQSEKFAVTRDLKRELKMALKKAPGKKPQDRMECSRKCSRLI